MSYYHLSTSKHDSDYFTKSSNSQFIETGEQVVIVDNLKTGYRKATYWQFKLIMEKMTKWVSRANGVRFVSLRYFNAAGAIEGGSIGEDHRCETHLIPLILQVPPGKRDQITIFSDDYPTPDGIRLRDYIHVLDLADAYILAHCR